MIAAATVSSQQARVNGEISPIRIPSSSTTATEDCSARDWEMAAVASEAGEWYQIVMTSGLIMPRDSMESAGIGEKRPIELRRNLITSSCVSQQNSRPL